jgi:hypothetical protein
VDNLEALASRKEYAQNVVAGSFLLYLCHWMGIDQTNGSWFSQVFVDILVIDNLNDLSHR